MRSDSRRYRGAPGVITFGSVWSGGGETIATVLNSRAGIAHSRYVISEARSSARGGRSLGLLHRLLTNRLPSR